MKNNRLYKYINLLTRIVIGIAAILFIYYKLRDNFFEDLDKVMVNAWVLALALLFVFVNWGIEAAKWKFAVRNIEQISFLSAFKYTLVGITMGLITPNRIGEIPSRAFLIESPSFKSLILRTAVSSYAQFLVTLIAGGISWLFCMDFFDLEIKEVISGVIIAMFGVNLLIYFKVNGIVNFLKKTRYVGKKEVLNTLSDFSLPDLMWLLLMSGFRYSIFFFQFYLVLCAFGICLTGLNELLLIPLCFFVASLVPTILLSEIGVRSSVALFIFGTVSNMDIQIIMASITLWTLNVAFPALLGVFNLKELKLIRSSS